MRIGKSRRENHVGYYDARRRVNLRIQFLLPAALFCATAWAADQFDIKPGLWDITTSMQLSGMPPIPNFDKMTPEQQARVAGAMQNMSGRAHTTKSCVTR